MALQHWLALSLADGVGPVLTRRLIGAAGSAQAACACAERDLRQIEGVGASRAATIRRSLDASMQAATAEIARADAAGVTILCPDDPAWPASLAAVADAPCALYVRGTIEPRDLNAMAIVGSRRCSHYGREQADRFAALLAGAGFTIISGGARGTDSAAHRGALQHPHGRTIAVLGCGVDLVYPPENDGLFKLIAQRGALVSEFPLGTPPLSENFPRRNRIISGLSRGVLVIEAAERSGALITARVANEDHGRPVFALPGRVDNALSAGPHLLIRDGATLVWRLEDILDGLGPLPQPALEPSLFNDNPLADAAPTPMPTPAHATAASPAVTSPGLNAPQRAILDHLDASPATADELIERTGLGAAQVLQELTLLSLKGLIRRVEGQTYSRAKSNR